MLATNQAQWVDMASSEPAPADSAPGTQAASGSLYVCSYAPAVELFDDGMMVTSIEVGSLVVQYAVTFTR